MITGIDSTAFSGQNRDEFRTADALFLIYNKLNLKAFMMSIMGISLMLRRQIV
jgi:hypothetical protein